MHRPRSNTPRTLTPLRLRKFRLRRQSRKQDTVVLEPVVAHHELLDMQRALEEVHVGEAVGKYMVDLARATREDGKVQVGASPRGVFALFSYWLD